MNGQEPNHAQPASTANELQDSIESRPANAGHCGGEQPCATFAPLKPRWVVLLAVAAITAFHLGFLFAPLSWLVLVWLGCLFALRRTSCGRWAFYTGLAIGLGIYGPQLSFFWEIFGPAAIALWLVLAFWLALFLLLLHGVERYWGTRWALALAPVLWLGIEFFRSELYYLRFSWFTAGSVLPVRTTGGLLPWLGVYCFGAVLVWMAAAFARGVEDRVKSERVDSGPLFMVFVTTIFLTVPVGLWLQQRGSRETPPSEFLVAGIQLEFPKESEVLHALENARSAEPKDERYQPALYLLSEYTFDGPVPEEVRAWCREKQRWLVAGGKEPLEGGKFYNTAIVVSTNGEIVFKQPKAVPIQFFSDGVPAPEQRVWDSPWGKIGICICYDLSYARIVDRLIRQGAQALLVPAMDTVMWGEHQHRLNARMTPIRAAEYRVPIFRVASSGISQLVNRHGRTEAELPFPSQGEVIFGTLLLRDRQQPRIPLDRYLAPAAVFATAVIMVWLGVEQRRARRRPQPSASS